MSNEPQMSFLIPLTDVQVSALYSILEIRIARVGLETEDGQEAWSIWKALDVVCGPHASMIENK